MRRSSDSSGCPENKGLLWPVVAIGCEGRTKVAESVLVQTRRRSRSNNCVKRVIPVEVACKTVSSRPPKTRSSHGGSPRRCHAKKRRSIFDVYTFRTPQLFRQTIFFKYTVA